MKNAALGFRAHSGWTSLVVISLEDGSPRVLLRERPHLVETFTFEFRQPYHTAEKRPPAEARSFISRVRTEARRLSYRSIHSIQTNLHKQGFELKCCGLLLASGKPLPDLAQILASHALIHAADGELFRETLLHACRRCGLETFTAKREGIARKGCALTSATTWRTWSSTHRSWPTIWLPLVARRKVRCACLLAFASVAKESPSTAYSGRWARDIFHQGFVV